MLATCFSTAPSETTTAVAMAVDGLVEEKDSRVAQEGAGDP
jgi:hypothetical protein